MTRINIEPAVALTEAQALVEHYRNRALLMAQAIADLKARVAELEAQRGADITEEDTE